MTPLTKAKYQINYNHTFTQYSISSFKASIILINLMVLLSFNSALSIAQNIQLIYSTSYEFWSYFSILLGYICSWFLILLFFFKTNRLSTMAFTLLNTLGLYPHQLNQHKPYRIKYSEILEAGFFIEVIGFALVIIINHFLYLLLKLRKDDTFIAMDYVINFAQNSLDFNEMAAFIALQLVLPFALITFAYFERTSYSDNREPHQYDGLNQ